MNHVVLLSVISSASLLSTYSAWIQAWEVCLCSVVEASQFGVDDLLKNCFASIET